MTYWAYEVPVTLGGTQDVVAAIRDVAGNMDYVTNRVSVSIVTNAAYAYNAAGCLTNVQYRGAGYTNTLALDWDSQYRLTSVETNAVLAERYAYDALGRMAWFSEGASTNHLVYDGVHVMAEVDNEGTLLKSYTWGPGIDNLLAFTVHSGSGTNTYWCLTDHLGSVHALVDEGGAIVESYRYDAWGRVLGVYDGEGTPLETSAVGNRYLWQGRWYSWSTGLYNFRARWYDPVTGRWLSNDPIGISGGLNQYVFCANNPVNRRDPWGLCTYNQEQSEDLIRQAVNDLVNDRWYRDLFIDAWRGHVGGSYDFKAGNSYATFEVAVNGIPRALTADQFGNYIAARAATAAFGPVIGPPYVYGGGVLAGWSGRGSEFRWFDDAGSREMIRAGVIDAIRNDGRWSPPDPMGSPNPVGRR